MIILQYPFIYLHSLLKCFHNKVFYRTFYLSGVKNILKLSSIVPFFKRRLYKFQNNKSNKDESEGTVFIICVNQKIWN